MPDKIINGKKAWGRRAITGIIATILTTVAFYVCLFKTVDISWFMEYSKTIFYIAGMIIGTLTITDSILGWKKQ